MTKVPETEMPPFKTTGRTLSAPPLNGLNVLVVDQDATTARLMRAYLEDNGAANVEIAATEDEALDILGNVPRPVHLVMMDTLTDGAACVGVLRVLVKHRARIYATLHGRHAPEDYAVPENLIGAAGYLNLAAQRSVALAEAVVAAGLTVKQIIEDRIVPATLDVRSALAIYGAGPRAPFPLGLRV